MGPKRTPLADSRIVELYWSRDELAIDETDFKYKAYLLTVAYNIVHDTQDCEECLNDAYMGAWNAIPPARPQSLGAFLSRIARNLALKRLEARTRQKRSGRTVSFEEMEEILGEEEAEQVSPEELGRHISEFLRREKEEARRVFLRKYYFLDSVSEIARQFSFSESKVKSMLYHTRQRLRAYLIKKGIVL